MVGADTYQPRGIPKRWISSIQVLAFSWNMDRWYSFLDQWFCMSSVPLNCWSNLKRRKCLWCVFDFFMKWNIGSSLDFAGRIKFDWAFLLSHWNSIFGSSCKTCSPLYYQLNFPSFLLLEAHLVPSSSLPHFCVLVILLKCFHLACNR